MSFFNTIKNKSFNNQFIFILQCMTQSCQLWIKFVSKMSDKEEKKNTKIKNKCEGYIKAQI